MECKLSSYDLSPFSVLTKDGRKACNYRSLSNVKWSIHSSKFWTAWGTGRYRMLLRLWLCALHRAGRKCPQEKCLPLLGSKNSDLLSSWSAFMLNTHPFPLLCELPVPNSWPMGRESIDLHSILSFLLTSFLAPFYVTSLIFPLPLAPVSCVY